MSLLPFCYHNTLISSNQHHLFELMICYFALGYIILVRYSLGL
ncbi:MAG: hypothetical protein LZF62_40006 [Nitrospira sp.]|nr:MAG: hypothetical protein LZF62_40006 [Nitrospira sp.]